MIDTKNQDRPADDRSGLKLKALISLAILLLGAAAIAYIFYTEPIAVREGATKETAMLVEVIGMEYGTFEPVIAATGTVIPAQDIILRPRVSGVITERAAAFTPGGFVQKGQMLLRLDPADYKNTLRQRQSELLQAEADLKIEMGRQDVARREYDLLAENLSPENRALVLRGPQLDTARAQVESARAAVAQAELELQRTRITAPFDAQILTQNVNIGSQVSVGDALGRLVGLNTYWVEATVPLAKLRWLSLPESRKAAGSPVRIRNRTAWPEDTYRTGHLFKVIGELEGQTRMARVLVEIEDPLGRKTGASDLPALMIGAFVETRITARELADVFRLNRDYVRERDTVWVMENDKLEIRKVDIVFSDSRYAYISSGLNKDDQVVTTNLATVAEGVGLRVQGEDAGSAGASQGQSETPEGN